MKTWVKVALSAGLIFHLTAIFIFPNPESILSRELSFLGGYGNFLGLNTTWRFFSPNPMIRSTEYEVFVGDAEPQVHMFPESVEASGSRETFNRTMNFAMLAAGTQEWAQTLLKPILCAKHSDADVISVYQIRREFYPIEKARLMKATGEPMFIRHRVRVTDLHCKDTNA